MGVPAITIASQPLKRVLSSLYKEETRVKTKQTLMAALVAVASVTSAQAQCLTDAQAADLVANYVAKTPAANPENLTDAGGATVDAAFGARPLYEADMLVRVKSAAINQAKTPMDVLDAVDQIIPFMELPDLMVQAPPKLNGAGVTAINVGARLGVAGTPIAVPAYRGERFAMLKALADMNVSLTDGAGARLGGGKGSDILEHPLNAVVWLAGALAQEGLAMQPGDLISLGSFSPLLPPKARLSVTATYDGLPGAAPVRVTFK